MIECPNCDNEITNKDLAGAEQITQDTEMVVYSYHCPNCRNESVLIYNFNCIVLE